MESSAEFGNNAFTLKTSAFFISKLREKVSQIYYKHGLLCSTHPWLVIVLSLIVVTFCCSPILGIHVLHNNHHQQYVTPLRDLVDDSGRNSHHSSSSVDGKHEPIADFAKNSPRWFQNSSPFAFVQQIIVKSAVIPWKNNLILMDAIRAPLGEVFPLVEYLSNHHLDSRGKGSISLNDVCFQVSEPVLINDNVASSYLPRYSCLLVSPANIWKNDLNKYLLDATIIKTLYSIKHLASPDSGNLREILFGEPWTETGIRRFFVRTRQRTIGFAITIVLAKYDGDFIDNLKHSLRERYPLDPFKGHNETDGERQSDANVDETENQVTHIHFQDQFSMSDYFPLMAAFLMLFLYIYFSVRKIDLIKYKWALACGSVLTVLLSLLMTVGICLWFDFNPTLNGSDILPYLVVIIGLENMLVLTKSVVSTPAHLDIKVRVAQGLSREGPSITKNLVLELSLLILGFFTFVPVIQEFCLFGMVGFLSDFFLQLTFFATILSVDIQRIELNKVKKIGAKLGQLKEANKFDDKNCSNNLSSTKATPRTVFARPSQPIHFKLPKRLRFVYFWARTRFVHRMLMICLVGWIALLVFRSGLVDHLNPTESRNFVSQLNGEEIEESDSSLNHMLKPEKEQGNAEKDVQISDTSSKRLLHQCAKPWNSLTTQHWSTLFGYYNISLSGRYISVLPPIRLSLPVEPSDAMRLRHPSESDPQIFRQLLSPSNIHTIRDPNDDIDDDNYFSRSNMHQKRWTSSEILFAIILSIPSVVFMVYVFVTLYRCMCSRNYAEWRSSWSESLKVKISDKKKEEEAVITETVPIILRGHEQEIEFISASEVTPFVVSCCMEGDIRVWDVLSGECHTSIKRDMKASNEINNEIKSFKPHHKPSGSFSSDSTYGSSPGNGSFEFPYELSNGKSDVYFSTTDSPYHLSSPADNGYDFNPFTNIMTSKSVIKELILNAATNVVTESQHEVCANVNKESCLNYQQVWCIDIFDKYIYLGCKNGRFEAWDALTGNLLYSSEPNNNGVTVIRANSIRVIVGHLNGVFEIYESTNTNGCNSHFINSFDFIPSDDRKMYHLVQSVRAHLQPVTALQLETSHIISGSADHLLKVYKVDAGMCLYTLHGHCGGITCIEVDKSTPSSALSGCQVGQVCVWDLMTGTCVFSLEAHEGAAVSSLLATPLYFISSGTDNRICVWDKYSGHLVHTITQHHSLCKQMLLLAPNILVTAKEDHLVLWDISEASPIRVVNLHSLGDNKSYIKNLRISSRSRAVVCEYGKLLCVIHFPGITEKND